MVAKQRSLEYTSYGLYSISGDIVYLNFCFSIENFISPCLDTPIAMRYLTVQLQQEQLSILI